MDHSAQKRGGERLGRRVRAGTAKAIACGQPQEMPNGRGQLEVATEALAGLLGELRSGNVADRKSEQRALDHHLKELSERWDQRFAGFPREPYPYASVRGVYRRRIRDEYLKKIIVGVLDGDTSDCADRTVVNPACVFGRHARDIASRLDQFKVIATDIDPTFNWFYKRVLRRRNPSNYQFVRDDIFNPTLKAIPTAVVFFGACGSVSDGAIDYAINTKCPYLICRTCCHDNIGGNTTITKRFNSLNQAFRLKNRVYAKRRAKGRGDYFSRKYSQNHYPTSEAAKGLSNSAEFMKASRNSVDSDVCRTIIDLDRHLRLAEANYDVWYKGELFVACRTVN